VKKLGTLRQTKQGATPISFFFVVVSQLKFSSVGVGDK
jgi:hypothetical protein